MMHDSMYPDGYLAPLRPPSRGMAWRMAIVNRNWNSCSEIRIYTPPASPVKKPAGQLTGTVISPISAFSLLLPSLPLLLPTEDFMAFQAAAVATLSIRGLLR